MKKTILPLLALLLAAVTQGYSQESPRTSITVTVRVEQQTIRTGPYARFAQKYLGVIAPLSDKKLSTFTGASLWYANSGETAASAATTLPAAAGASGLSAVSHTRNTLDFTKVPVDRKDFTERSLEDAAREAASTIFSLRKHRLELITGMAGENVFGAGLPAALAEIDRLEEEYLALFMGKQSVQTVVRSYTVTPEAGETNRIVCRFSETEGLLPTDDLSGSPVVLEMKSLLAPPAPVPAGKAVRNAPPTVRQYIPGKVACRLLEGKNELARETIPVYQMGTYIDVPAR